ncbi:MAG: universal stress protein [Burkholderiaceae bacterium]
MYKHILLPTDGSALSQQAIRSGVLFAKNTGATVTGIHVIPRQRQDKLEAWAHHDEHYAEKREALFEKIAEKYLAYIANSALAEGIPCTCKLVKSDEPFQAIVKTAEKEHCDLIFMASHGWKGDSALMLGSETSKVLLHSKVPVLVHKPITKH